MTDVRRSRPDLLRKPGALIPVVLSLAGLVLLIGYVAQFGIARQEDEGTAARIFQLLMLADAVAIVYFAIRWVPVAPKQGLAILAMQVVLAAIPLGTLMILEW